MERMGTIYKSNRNHYFLSYGSSEVIDGHVKGTAARYINHSCAPNCHIEKWYVDGEYRVGVFASRPIEKGEELSYDYNFESFGTRQACRCGAAKCKGFIGTSKLDQGKENRFKVLKEPREPKEIRSKSYTVTQRPKTKAQMAYHVQKQLEREHQTIRKGQVFLMRNLAPAKYPSKSLAQVLREQGLYRIRLTRIFLMRNLAPLSRKPKHLDEINMDWQHLKER